MKLKRLIRKASSSEFYHMTSKDNLISILQNGLLPSSETSNSGSFTQDTSSIMGDQGVYLGNDKWKEWVFENIDDNTALIACNVDTSNLVIDPECLVMWGPYSLGQESFEPFFDIIDYLVHKDSDFEEMLIEDFGEDWKEILENDEEELEKILDYIRENLLEKIPYNLCNDVSGFVYLGSISPNEFTTIWVANDEYELEEFKPNQFQELITELENNEI